MLLETFPKTPAETYTKAIDYTDRLPTGATPSAVSLAAVDMLDNSSAAGVVGSGSASGNTSLVPITGGTDGHDYLLTFTTTLSNGNVLEDHCVMQVRTTF